METGGLNTPGRPSGVTGLELEPIRPDTIRSYADTGKAAYSDHYCHLWPGGDPNPYISRNFTEEVVLRDLEHPGYSLFILNYRGDRAGICKWVTDGKAGPLKGKRPFFIEKVYFKKAFTGKGLGSELMRVILDRAAAHHANYLWLEAMKKGPALSFYHQWGFGILGETQVPYPEVLPQEKAMWVLGRPVSLPAHAADKP